MKVSLKQKKKAFTMLSNIIANDNKISLKAKGMCLIIAHFPPNWTFYEENMQNYTKDGRTAISNALKELEDANYLYREQLRKKGKFANKIWIFNDEGLNFEEIIELCPECRKADIRKYDDDKSATTNTHSTNKQESNKKNTQKKNRKKKYYDFVNKLKKEANIYPNLLLHFNQKQYCFIQKNGLLLLQDRNSGIILSKVQAEDLYKKMSKSFDLKIERGLNNGQ